MHQSMDIAFADELIVAKTALLFSQNKRSRAPLKNRNDIARLRTPRYAPNPLALRRADAKISCGPEVGIERLA
jgi:hypothetical protein